MTYRGVQVREAALADPGAATADPGSRARLWSRLNTGILDPASEATDPRLLAQQIGAEVAARPGVALTGLRESLVGTVRALADRPQDEQRAGLDRMRELLNGLGPQLRASLGRAAADSRHAADRAARPTDDTMNARITEALGRGESAGASLSPEAVMLCQKLADLHRAAPDDDAEPSDAAAGTVAEDNPAEAMANAIESLFSRFDPTEFTPDDYRDQIRGTMDPADPAAPRPGIERAFAAETLSVRCAHIAHDLLAADAGDPSPALQEVIAASIVPLIDARAFGVLSDRLRCGDPSLTLALSRDTVIDHVLAADVPVPAGDGDSGAASEPSAPTGHDHAVIAGLLQLAGDRAVQRITHRMVVGDNPPRNGPAAVRVLAAAPARLRRDALHNVLSPASGPVPLAAAPLLSGMAFNAATDLLKPHLNAPQISERRAAYALLAAAFPQWPARFLSHGSAGPRSGRAALRAEPTGGGPGRAAPRPRQTRPRRPLRRGRAPGRRIRSARPGNAGPRHRGRLGDRPRAAEPGQRPYPPSGRAGHAAGPSAGRAPQHPRGAAGPLAVAGHARTLAGPAGPRRTGRAGDA